MPVLENCPKGTSPRTTGHESVRAFVDTQYSTPVFESKPRGHGRISVTANVAPN